MHVAALWQAENATRWNLAASCHSSPFLRTQVDEVHHGWSQIRFEPSWITAMEHARQRGCATATPTGLTGAVRQLCYYDAMNVTCWSLGQCKTCHIRCWPSLCSHRLTVQEAVHTRVQYLHVEASGCRRGVQPGSCCQKLKSVSKDCHICRVRRLSFAACRLKKDNRLKGISRNYYKCCECAPGGTQAKEAGSRPPCLWRPGDSWTARSRQIRSESVLSRRPEFAGCIAKRKACQGHGKVSHSREVRSLTVVLTYNVVDQPHHEGDEHHLDCPTCHAPTDRLLTSMEYAAG